MLQYSHMTTLFLGSGLSGIIYDCPQYWCGLL